MSEELDIDTLKVVLSAFASRMGAKWDFIGIQLRQGDLVQQLRSSPQLGQQKVQQIIEEWLGSDDKHVPVCAATVSRVLRSAAVRLGAVAKDFEKEVQTRLASQHAAQQRSISLPPHASPGAYPPAGSYSSHLEGAESFADGRSPSSPPSVPQDPHPSSAANSLALPQQAKEEAPAHQPASGGGRADSAPVQGLGSLAQQPIEEQGRQPAQDEVLRGPGHGGDEVRDGPVAPVAEEDVLELTMRHFKSVLQEHYCRRPGNEVAMANSFGQRSLPFHERARIASAVCRTVWELQIERKKIYGSGSIVTCFRKFYLLTSCHNFLKKEDGDRVQHLEDDYVKKKMKKKCQIAEYLFSGIDFKSTVALPADVVLKDRGDPVLIFDQKHDLLAVEVNDPETFPGRLEAGAAAALIKIQPIPLQPALMRESLLESALLVTITHFPREDSHRAECVEFAVGLRLGHKECQDTQVVYAMDTFHGSSGAPVLFTREEETVLLAVHRKSIIMSMRDATGAVTSTGYNVGSVLTQNFLGRLFPNDHSVSDSTA